MNDPLPFDPTLLLLSFIPSGIGFVLFVYGKKMARPPQLVAGLLLMIYPYFATTVLTMTAIGVLVVAALWVALQLDY